MTEYNEGDLVEAVRDDTVIRGRAVASFGKHLLGLSGRIMEELENNGFTLTVIEKAAPKNVLPTEAGFYVGNYDKSPSGKILIELLNSPEGQWVDNTDSRYLDVEWVQKLGNLTRLEAVPVTAKAVIETVVLALSSDLGDHWTTRVRAVGSRFGVSS